MPATISKKIGKKKGHPGIQGITSKLDDLQIAGMNLRAVVGDAFVSGTLERTIAGASSLTLEIHDEGKHLLNSALLTERHQVTLDGLAFDFTKVSMGGGESPLVLTYEPDVVARIRAVTGPHKAFRQKLTRAEFINRLILLAKGPDIRFVCPELHVKQPIEDARSARDARRSAETERGKGLNGEQNLTVKGVAATAAQRKLGDDAMRIAGEHSAPQRVVVALMEALIVESVMGSATSNVLEAIGSGGAEVAGPFKEITNFLTGSGGYGGGGAIGYFKANPNAKAYEIAQGTQRSGAGRESNGKANYGAWEDEAKRWVEGYEGEGSTGGTTGPPQFVKYAFEQKQNESAWACAMRLAKEVNWRFFESAGWIYFISETDLLNAVRRMTVRDDAPWLIDTSFDYDLGKPVSEMTVSAIAHAWAAPPGSVAAVRDHGPANGPWLVSSITSPLEEGDSLVEIKLKRPTKPLPEPPPSTKKTSTGRPSKGGEGASAGAPAGVEKMIAFIEATDAKHYPYSWGGGHNASFSPPYDCSGFVSATLHAAGLLNSPLVSGAMMNLYQPGEGEWLTIYADGGHAFGKIRTASGWRFFGTSDSNPNGGAGWVPSDDPTSGQPNTAGKAARHPSGY